MGQGQAKPVPHMLGAGQPLNPGLVGLPMVLSSEEMLLGWKVGVGDWEQGTGRRNQGS